MTQPITTPFGFTSTTDNVLAGIDLTGKRALVTGANSGLGFETARALASAGASVTVAARNAQAGLDAAAQISASVGDAVDSVQLDLSDLDSVRAVTDAWTGPLHLLVNNAGIMALPELTRSREGHEMQFAVNFLGHFALTTGLHGALTTASGARIVSLSSNAHLFSPVVFGDIDYRFRPYHPLGAYAESKTAMALLAVEATHRWSAEGIFANAAHPGAIATGLQAHAGGLQTPEDRRKTIAQGAATTVFLASSPLLEGIGGRYFEDINESPVLHQSPVMFGGGVADYALNPSFAAQLWDRATEMIA